MAKSIPVVTVTHLICNKLVWVSTLTTGWLQFFFFFFSVQKDSHGAKQLQQFCSAALGQLDEQLSNCTSVPVLVVVVMVYWWQGVCSFGSCMFWMLGDGVRASSFKT